MYHSQLSNINHRGIAIYLRNELCYKRLYELEDHAQESIWLEISQPSGKFLLTTIYRPPLERVSYWDELERNIENARDKYQLPIYLCGDLNDNILTNSSYIEPLLERQGLQIINREVTYYTSTSANCLDLFATSKPQDMCSIQTTSPTLSGHSSLILSKNIGLPKGKRYTRKVLDYNKTNWARINEEMRQH